MNEHSDDIPVDDTVKIDLAGGTSNSPDALAAVIADEEIDPSRYALLSILGSGGAGIVYKARDKVLNRVVAIKKLHSSATPEQALRFQREARIAGALKHPNILEVLNFGLTARSEPYLVLEYVEGETLSQHIERLGPMVPPEVHTLLLQIADGLAYAHRSGVVHRDIKPGNIMLISAGNASSEPVVKILDFGLAKDDGAHQQLTSAGVGMGTPAYMSPEQIRGGTVDARSDIYSFGCLLYQVLTGKLPYRGETALETLHMHLDQEIPSLSKPDEKITSGLETIVRRCLNKDPAGRFQAVEQLQRALVEDLERVIIELEPEETEPEVAPLVKVSLRDWILQSVRKPSGTAISIALLLILGMVVFRLLPSNKNRSVEQHKFKPDSSKMTSAAVSLHDIYLDKGQNIWRSNLSTNEELERFLDKHRGEKYALDLSLSQVTPEGLELLAGHDIDFLIFGTMPINDKNMAAISKIESLRDLDFGDTADVDFAAIAKLATLPDLKIIEFNGIDFKGISFQPLSKLSHVEDLRMEGCWGFTADGFRQLKKMSSLKTLNLSTSTISEPAFDGLVELPIEVLVLRHAHASDAGLLKLVKMKRLKHLGLVGIKDVDYATQEDLKRRMKNVSVSMDEKPPESKQETESGINLQE